MSRTVEHPSLYLPLKAVVRFGIIPILTDTRAEGVEIPWALVMTPAWLALLALMLLDPVRVTPQRRRARGRARLSVRTHTHTHTHAHLDLFPRSPLLR